jgi:proteasome lid subunit RPN8/RPN11
LIVLAPAHAAEIRDHGRRAYPEECCGVLLGSGAGAVPEVRALRAADNVHDGGRRRRFTIAPGDYLAAEREARRLGLEVLGFYHSHPDHPARPSEHDRLHAWPNLHYVIVAVAAGEPGEITSWLLAEDRSALEPEPLVISEPSDGAQSAPYPEAQHPVGPVGCALRTNPGPASESPTPTDPEE